MHTPSLEPYHIINLEAQETSLIEQAADLLLEGFKEHWRNAWREKSEAMEEVQEALQPDRICRIALRDGFVLGWVGAIRAYDGYAWELHPLVVHPRWQGQGIGSALVKDLEAQVLAQGGITVFLGTDDEDDMTSLAGVDLYPNPLEHMSNIKNLRQHPYEFYQKLGYVLTGIIPDANGFGKPDLMMAKRIAPIPHK